MNYKIEFWDNDKYSSLRGNVIEMPIIPRVGDNVSLEYSTNGYKDIGVWRVEHIYLNQSSKDVQAVVHVTSEG